MSLRARLVLTVLALLTLGLGLTAGATFGALQDWRADREDELLTAAADEVAAQLPTRPPGSRLEVALTPDGLGPLWRRMAEDGDIPSFFQLRSSSGRVLETVGLGLRPQVSQPLPADLLSAAATADGEDAPRLSRAATAAPDGSGAAPYWRLLTQRLTGRDEILIVGLQTKTSDELLSRTAKVMVITSGAVLVGVALLSLRSIRRALRPLDAIATTADAIGAGDLTRRVDEVSPRTEVGRLGHALNVMLGQIETAFRARQQSEDRLRRFVADASHELRTPIATIRGYAELFRRGASTRPDDLADAMRRIESEGARMGRLVDELLLLARLDQGRPLEREPVELAGLVADAIVDARAVEPSRPLHLDHDGEVVVVGDAARLREVLDNLISNVGQHTPTGAAAAVRIGTDGDNAVVEVTDSGPGLSAEQRERVFERFFRVDDSRQRQASGSGLGLSIVAAVVQAHGGTVEARSAAGGGTTFRVCIPRDNATASAEPPSGRPRAPLAPGL